MPDNNVDNGETENPVENDIGIINQDSLVDKMRGILFSDEQDEGNPEPYQQEGEDQIEDSSDGTSDEGDGLSELDDDTNEAEDGTDVLSQDEDSENTDEPVQETVGVQKRIDKLTALRKTAEEKVAALQSEVDDYKARLGDAEKAVLAPKATTENPFGDLDTIEKIKAEYEEARQLRYKCEENPEGFEVGETFFNSTQVKAMKVNAMKAMEQQLPKQLEFVKARELWRPKAMEIYPWLKNKETSEYKLAQQVLNNFPQFRNFPDYELFVGDYVRGYMARSSSKTKIPAKVPPLNVRATSSQTNTTRTDTSGRTPESRYLKSGKREDLKSAVLKFL